MSDGRMNYEPDDIDYNEDAKVTGTIVDSDLSPDRIEALARKVVDTWDMDAIIDYAISALCDDYQHDIDRAVEDANELEFTVEELDRDISNH